MAHPKFAYSYVHRSLIHRFNNTLLAYAQRRMSESVNMDSTLGSILNKPLSKGALKRQAREERTKEQRKQKRLEKKEEKRQHQLEHQASGQPDVTWDALPYETRNPTRQEKRALQQESHAKAQSSVTIAIDCAFESYMTEAEKKVSVVN